MRADTLRVGLVGRRHDHTVNRVDKLRQCFTSTEWTCDTLGMDPDTARRIRRGARKLAEGQAERDDAIRQAKAEGATLREIAAVAGLSPMGVKKIVDRSP